LLDDACGIDPPHEREAVLHRLLKCPRGHIQVDGVDSLGADPDEDLTVAGRWYRDLPN
jgi:hypothetical protein